MKKLFFTLCITFCLLFSSAATVVRADDGDGHAPGYICVESETVNCPPDSNDPPQQGETSGSNNSTAEEDTTLTLLNLIITIILKS